MRDGRSLTLGEKTFARVEPAQSQEFDKATIAQRENRATRRERRRQTRERAARHVSLDPPEIEARIDFRSPRA